MTDPNGAPVAMGDLDFFVASTGVKLFTPGDNTDATGFYNVCVLPNIYRVTYAPPLGTRLMGKQFFGVDLRSEPGMELDVTLDFGTVLSGRITDTSGVPVDSVDVDVDAVGGGRIFTPDDNSNPSGDYRVVVPDGLYRVRFDPLIRGRLRGVSIDSVLVAGDRVLDVVLPVGVVMSGTVRDRAGAGIPEVDFDLRDRVTGAKIFVSGNTTNAAGNYRVVVPTGTFELRFAPSRASRFVGVRFDSLVIAGDQRLDVTLDAGVRLSAVVQDSLGVPVAKADLDLIQSSTGSVVFTPNDKTDSLGTADIQLLPDVYTVEFNPPVGSAFDLVVLPDVPILRDTTLTVTMPEVTRARATGRLVDGLGQGIADVKFEAHRLPARTRVFLPNDLTDAGGNFDLAIPLGNYDVLMFPPRGARFLGHILRNVAVERDSAWGDITLPQGVLVSTEVTDAGGAPVVGADLDFIRRSTGVEVFTPNDNTVGDGVAIVAVPPDRYDVLVTPPAGSTLDPLTVEDVDVRGDTALAVVLGIVAPPPGGRPFVLEKVAPNPFRPLQVQAAIEVRLARASHVRVDVYDVRGRRKVVLFDGDSGPGPWAHTCTWDGRDAEGTTLPTGIYIVQLETDMGRQGRKVLLLH